MPFGLSSFVGLHFYKWFKHLTSRYYYCSLLVPLLLSHIYFSLSHSHRNTPLSPPTQPSFPLQLNPPSPYSSTLLPPTAQPSLPLHFNPLSPYTSTLSPLTPQPSLPLHLNPLSPYTSTLSPPTLQGEGSNRSRRLHHTP